MADTDTPSDPFVSGQVGLAGFRPPPVSAQVGMSGAGGMYSDDVFKPIDPRLQSRYLDTARREAETSRDIATSTRAQLDKDRARAESAYNAAGAGMDNLQPFDAQKTLQQTQSSPMDRFASFGSILGLLASSFTRTPVASSFNALAGAAEAMKANDNRAYDIAFEQWKVNTDLALKRHQMQHERFSDALQLMNTDIHAGEAKLREAATQFGHEKYLTLVENGMIPELMQFHESEAKAAEGMAKARMELLEHDAKRKALIEFDREEHTAMERAQFISMLNSRRGLFGGAGGGSVLERDIQDYQSRNPGASRLDAERATSEARHPPKEPSTHEKDIQEYLQTHEGASRLDAEKAIGEAKRAPPKPPASREQTIEEYIKNNPGATRLDAEKAIATARAVPTGNKINEEKILVEEFGYSLDKIDSSLQKLNQHTMSAGAAGAVLRYKEAVTNIFGVNDTDRKQFERDIHYLREMAPGLLHERQTGRPLSAEAAHIDKIIAGLNMQDTTFNTMRSLKEIQKLYRQMRGDIKSRIGGEEPAGRSRAEEPVTPASSAPSQEGWWADFPDAK